MPMFLGRDFPLLTVHKWLGSAYSGPWSVGCLQAKMVRRLLTGAETIFCLQMPRPRRLLTTAQGLKRPWPSSAYSPSAAYKLGPGRAGRCLQSNRCLQARAGPSRPLLTVQPLLTSPVRAEPAAAYRATAAYKLTLARSSCRLLLGERAHPSGAGTFLQTTATPAVCSACPASHSACNGTEHDAWITGAPGALARLERAG